MTNRLFFGFGELPDRRRRWALMAILLSITFIGFYFRFRCLGCLGFRWDEDLTALAVKALLDKGVPELPSGMIYVRFYPLQLIIARSVELFGFSEFSMRLPSVIFGTLLIPAVYWVGKRFIGERVALIVAICVTLSFWQVEMARTARMYAPFFLIYLIAAYTIFHCHFRDNKKIFSPLVLLTALLALTMHQLAYSLALLLLLAIPLNRSLIRALSLGGQAAIIGIAFVAINVTQQRYFNIPRAIAESAENQTTAENTTGALTALLQQVSLPDLTLISQVAGTYTISAIVAVTATVLITTQLMKRVWDRGVVYVVLTLLSVALALTHQFNLVIVILTLMLIWLKSGIGGIRNPDWYVPAMLCASIFALWLMVIAAITIFHPSDMTLVPHGPRKLVRALMDYPNFRLFWSYALERPLLAIPLALGTLWGVDRIARDRPDAVALFLVGSFWLVLFVNGVLTTKFEFFRYNLHLDPIYLILVVTGILAIPSLLKKVGIPRPRLLDDPSWKRIGPFFAATVAIIGVNPFAAVLTSQRNYTESAYVYSLSGLDHYVDFKTPALFVRDRMREDDLVLVLDPREYWNYIGRVDYWIRTTNYKSQTYSDDGRARDLYLGIPLVHQLEELTRLIDSHPGTNVWILLSTDHLDRTPWISLEIKAYLESLEDHIVYTGLDQDTVVLRLPE